MYILRKHNNKTIRKSLDIYYNITDPLKPFLQGKMICSSCLLVVIFMAVAVKGDWLVRDETFTDKGTMVFNGTKMHHRQINFALQRTYRDSDGEAVDALEHFFYGQYDGIAMELGGLEGTLATG
jgi:hypothetical protein